MALTQITTNGIKDGTITGTDLATNVDLVDNQRLRLGTGNDLQIYHDGSTSYILENGTGELNIKTNGTAIALTKTPHENLARFIVDGAVELYYDNSKKFNTRTNGIQVQGRIIFDSDTNTYIEHGTNGDEIQLVTGSNTRLLVDGHVKNPNDNSYIFVGASNDLGLVHDGSNSIIKNTTNSLFINSAAHIYLGNADNSEYKAKFHNNSSVELYFDNSKKFETTSAGATITGALTTTGNINVPTGNGIVTGSVTTTGSTALTAVDNGTAYFGTGLDLRIFHDGSNSYIQNNGGNLILKNSSANYIQGVTSTGAVELNYNGSKKFETTSDGAKVSGEFLVEGNLKRLFIKDTNGTGGSARPGIVMQDSAASNQFFIGNGGVGSTELQIINYTDASIAFRTNNTDRLEIDNNGHVQIPADNKKLQIGAGQDLQIYHDGTHSYIQNTTGDLRIIDTTGMLLRSNSLGLRNGAGDEKYIECANNGAVELYHDNSKKLETTSTGAKISSTAAALRLHSTTDQQTAVIEMTSSADQSQMGSIKYNHTNSSIVSGYLEAFLIDGTETNLAVKVDGAIKIPDSGTKGAKLLIGAGDDLQIYHNGTNSFIENSTGSLYIRDTSGGDVRIQGKSGEDSIICNDDGAVELYHDNDRVFYTETRGVRIGDNTKIFENSGQNTAIMQHGDIHHAIIFRGSSNAGGTTITNANVTTFREYGDFVFMTGPINMSTRLTIAQNGNIGAPSGTNIYNASDSRLKKNVVTLDKGLDAIKALRPVSFNWIDGFCDEEKDTLYGFVAQEAQTVDSNLVAPFGGDVNIGNDPENPDQTITDPLRVNEKYIIPMLVKAIQELTAKVEALEAG